MAGHTERDTLLSGYARSLIAFKAKQLSRKPGFTRSEEEDLAQELTMGLLAQAHRFDPTRASANTFAARVIESKIAMILRDRGRQKRAAGLRAQSLEQVRSREGDAGGSLRESVADTDARRLTGAPDEGDAQAETAAAVIRAYASLPPELQAVCRQLIEGTPSSAAHELGISRRQIGNAIERIRWHFEAAGLGDS